MIENIVTCSSDRINCKNEKFSLVSNKKFVFQEHKLGVFKFDDALFSVLLCLFVYFSND